ncbi:MerR family transcriptional regulator [Candidatus Bathyarchaeota archaeon]|nr:MerR family transcriptional regulator [Candidatus Bathyarchaeota archaeon]
MEDFFREYLRILEHNQKNQLLYSNSTIENLKVVKYLQQIQQMSFLT